VQLIGRYRIDGVLGAGAMGTVYRAFDTRIERAVALKTIRKDMLAGKLGAEVQSRFRTEARAAGRLVHPNIVTIYDFDEDQGVAFIAMELVQGRPLDTLLRDGATVPLQQAAHWVNQLLEALHYAHSQGIAHRDIKPANLLVTDGDQVKVADFGIAKIFSADAAASQYLAGTPEYMSPEQFLGLPIDGRSDLFSAGIVLYQLLTGKKPFTGQMAVVMQQILNQNPPPPSSARPSLPPAVDSVVAKALEKDAANRYASARDFAAALSAACRAEADSSGGETVVAASDRLGPAEPSGADFRSAGPAAAAPAAAGPTTAPHATAAPATAGSTMVWNPEMMQRLETQFALAVGPMARVLMRKEAARADSETSLVDSLLKHIPTEEGRTRFLAAAKAQGAMTAAANAPAAPPPADATMSTRIAGSPVQATASIDPQRCADAEKALLRYIGPFARVVVQRTARQSSDLRAFYAALAQQIPDAGQRDRFLREMGAE